MKEYILAGIAIIGIWFLYLFWTGAVKYGRTQCELKQANQEVIKTETITRYRNIYVKENIKTRAVSINDKFDFLRSECTDCTTN